MIAKIDDALHAAASQATALLPLANAGNARALTELRHILDGHPELWTSVGNLAAQAELSLLQVAAGENDVVREAISRKLSQLRRDLAGPEPFALERLLVDRVVAGWFALTYAETQYHQRLRNGLDWAESENHQRQIDRAQRRYLAAIRTLATVRRLLVPTLQVNIAEEIKQLNVAR
ncbi:MAG: hypothetical protein ACJ789_21250 [Thermomicrobiales bacterium]